MRHQATPDRVCSLTAFVLLLRELLPTDVVPEYLLRLLHCKSEVVLRMSNKEWKATNGLNHKHKAIRESQSSTAQSSTAQSSPASTICETNSSGQAHTHPTAGDAKQEMVTVPFAELKAAGSLVVEAMRKHGFFVITDLPEDKKRAYQALMKEFREFCSQR